MIIIMYNWIVHLPEFFWLAAMAGTCVALLCGPMGSLMVWQRMSYFGDTLAHAGLLGVALATVLSLNVWAATIAVCVLIGGGLRLLERQQMVPEDALLGLLSHAVLAVGIILASSLKTARLNMSGLLFGDILALGLSDVLAIMVVTGLVLCGVWKIWAPLLSSIVSVALAQLEGVPVARVRTQYILLLSMVIALAVKVVGVLLITALLVIPAASTRFISRSPEKMALFSSLLGIAAVWLGLGLSFSQNWPAGPSIIVVSVLFFIGFFCFFAVKKNELDF